MLRIFVFLTVAFASTFTAVWIAEQSGHVRLVWGGYLVETSVSVFFGMVIATVVFWVLVFQLTRIILGAPGKFIRGRKVRAQARGYRALMRGMVAVAAGDVKAAKREAKRVEALGVARPLRLLLSAQTFQLAGEESEADQSFRLMLSDPESALLGLRGLLVQALRNGEIDEATDLARQAYKLNPDADWVLSNLVDLETRGRNWPEAEKALLAAERRKIVGPGDFQKRLALILFQQAKTALEKGSIRRAEGLVLRAVRLRPSFVPAVKLSVDLLLSSRRLKRAKLLVQNAWAEQRHPELAELYVKIFKPESPMDRLRVLETLVSSAPDDPESLLLTADAALNASLWGAAREKLGKVVDSRPDKRLYRLMARLEQLEHGDEDAARQWLLKATKANDQAQWSCGVCSLLRPDWVMQCPSCHTIDSFQWTLLEKQDHSPLQLSRVSE